MQQLLHGLRLSAAEDLSTAGDLERLARMIERSRATTCQDNSRRRA